MLALRQWFLSVVMFPLVVDQFVLPLNAMRAFPHATCTPLP
jgi:hypothetical protein